MNRTNSRLAMAVSAVLFIAPTQHANAQDAEGETERETVNVIGKAIKHELEDTRETPQSISVVSAVELEQFSVQQFTNILSRLGSIRWNSGNARTGSLSLRGLTASPGNHAVDPSIGANIDGVSYADLAIITGSNYVDIESISVTRGPHGTRGGKSTSLGLISIETVKPKFEPDATASLTLGDRDTIRAWAAGGGSVIDGLLAGRVTFYREQGNGAWGSDYPGYEGRSSYNNKDRTYGRAQLLLTPTEDFEARLSFDITPDKREFINGLQFRKATPDFYANGGRVNKDNAPEAKIARSYFADRNLYTVDDYYNAPAFNDRDSGIIHGNHGGFLDLTWNRWGAKLSSLSAWRNHTWTAGNEDNTPFDVTVINGLVADFEQFSQQFSVDASIGDLVDYRTGLYYLTTKSEENFRTVRGADNGAWNANPGQYTTLSRDAVGLRLLRDSTEGLHNEDFSWQDNESLAFFAHADWHLTDTYKLTTGIRVADEKRRGRAQQLIRNQGVGAAFNPESVFDVRFGGFNATAAGSLDSPNGAFTNTPEQLAIADTIATKYFNVAATGVPGQAYRSLTAQQQQQVAAARAIRLAQLGTRFLPVDAEPYKGTVITSELSLSKDFSPNLTGYVTWGYNEKAGISQINGATARGGTSVLVDPEKSSSYELGLKTSLFGDSLVLNANLFVNDIKDYQQTVFFLDEVLTELNNDGTQYYRSGYGNVGKVRTQGVEIDAEWAVSDDLSLSLSGAYVDAEYKDHKFSGQPSERSNEGAFRDVSGFTLHNAPKVQFNVAANYTRPIFSSKLLNVNANYNYQSRSNFDAALSEYGWVNGYGIADLSVGVGRDDGTLDVRLIASNLLDEDYRTAGWSSYYVNPEPRWYGISLTAKWPQFR